MQGAYLQKGDFGIFPANLAKGKNPYQQTVLAWLWKHKNQDGVCWPSLKTLTEETGMSRRKLLLVLEELEKGSLIVKSSRHDDKGGQTSNMYEVIAYPELVIIEKKEPEPEPEPVEKVNWATVVEFWNKLANQYELKKIHSTMSDQRKTHYKARCAENGGAEGFWGIVRRELGLMSDWGKRNQVSSFGWIIASASNFERFAEGKYRKEDACGDRPRLRVMGE